MLHTKDEGIAEMEDIRVKFAVIDDYRHSGYIKHKLADVLTLIMGAVISGITELADMMVYFENKIGFFKEHFGIEQYPSKPTISRILNMIDGEAVGTQIIEIMRESVVELGNIIAVDGKAIRSTSKKGKSHSALQMLTAYVTSNGVVLGQEAILHEDKTNEIPVFQNMLDNLDVKGKTITADAMHCQKVTCAKIIDKGGDYLFGLKGNQSNMLGDVELYLGDPINNTDIASYETLEKNGGRIEKRICSVSGDVTWIHNLDEWRGLQSIFSIKRVTEALGKTTEETSYYISSLPPDPKKLLETTREHWKIESMHWMLDVVWHEDECGLLSDNGHKSLNAFRKLALLAHKKFVAVMKKKRSIKGNVLAAALNDDVLLAVIDSL
jgi:predicted transposase YbfD/YdcC